MFRNIFSGEGIQDDQVVFFLSAKRAPGKDSSISDMNINLGCFSEPEVVSCNLNYRRVHFDKVHGQVWIDAGQYR